MTYLTGYTGNITVAGDILPAASNAYSLGSNTAKWADQHIGPNSIYIQDTANANLNAALTVTNGVLFIDGASQVQAPGIQNGNSNITITANSNISLTANGNTTFTVTSTGANVTGNLAVTGTLTSNTIYGQFWSTTTQTVAVANAAYAATFNNTDGHNGVQLGTGASNSQVIISRAGTYNIQFSAQINHPGGGQGATTYLWFTQNGTAIPGSAGEFSSPAGVSSIQSWNTLVTTTTANEYIGVGYTSTQTDVVLPYYPASGNIPAVPSVIITVTPVGA